MAAPTVSHLALLMFVIQFSLLLGLGTLGFAGIEALAPVAPACMLQAPFCAPAIIALAARLALAPYAAAALSLVIVATPPLLASIGATLRVRKADTESIRHYTETLLDTRRSRHGGGGRQLRESLEKMGYVSPPELVALRERQRTAVKNWMAANPGLVARAQEDASKSSRYATRPGMTFNDDLMNNLEEATGSNWVFMNSFLEKLSKSGLKYELQLSEDERAAARTAIEVWLDEHWDSIKATQQVGEATGSEAGDGWVPIQPFGRGR